MQLVEIPEVELIGGGVMFQYLILEVGDDNQTRTLLRGMNYQKYLDRIPERILSHTQEELRTAGVAVGSETLVVAGGGTITMNPYTEEITLFGASTAHGPETDRAATAAMLERAFPEHKVTFFAKEEEKAEPSKSD